MENPVFEAVRTVLAVREYQEREVPEDVLLRILEAGRLTASGGNQQPWHFVVVRDRADLRELGSLVRTAPYIAQAPLAIVVGCARGSRIALTDAARAIQSMILTAWAEGVGSNWAGFAGLDGVRSKVELPDTFEVISVLPLGYPRRKLGRGIKNRKPLSEVASDGRFGRPLNPKAES